MIRTSLGFHTFMIFLKITPFEARQLLAEFKRYSEANHSIKIIPDKQRDNYFTITYTNGNKGIIWRLITHSNDSPSSDCYIKAIINPKILGGVIDYVTAATAEDVPAAVTNFNLEAKRISPTLSQMSAYRFSRIDYCINFDVEELGIECKPESLMALIKKANIPKAFKERMQYDPVAHREKPCNDSFYLKSKNPSSINPSICRNIP